MIDAIYRNETEKFVLLSNISVISLDVDRKRIVFNFMNNIYVFGRYTPDYQYFSYDSKEEVVEAFDKIKSLPYIRLNYFISNSENKDLVNREAITTLNLKEEELKIIFNLNFSVTSYKDNSKIEIGKFIFWTYHDEDEFDEDRLEINEILKNKIGI